MKTFWVLLLLAALGAGGWYWYERTAHPPGEEGGRSATPAAPTAPAAARAAPPPVRVDAVQIRRFETVLESLGTAQANESLTLTAAVTAHVTEVLFEDGQTVVAGQLLLRLASAEELADQREATVTLNEQRRELERIRGLSSDGIVPRQQVEQQRTRVEGAEARLAAVEARLANRVIRAPFAGVLGLRRVSQGTLVTPGTPIADLDDIARIKVDFTVPERFLGAVRPGMPIEARSTAFRDQVYRGEITAISTRVDVATRSVTLRALVDNAEGSLRPGMLLSTRLPLEPAERPAVPEGALVASGDQYSVFIVTPESRVRRQDVRIGRRQPGFVEILEGLEPGMRIVTEGTLRIRPGMVVRIVEAAT